MNSRNSTPNSRSERFFEQYGIVFDERGKVKLCGRENCKELIKRANAIDPNTDYGNVETGCMNVQSMILLKESLAEFLALYGAVFDEKGRVRLCKRKRCRRLICLARAIDSAGDFGCKRSAFMNTENMTALWERLTK